MRKSELKILKDKCLLYTQFVIQKMSISPSVVSSLQETYRMVEKAYDERDIKPLRRISDEIDEQIIRHMPLSLAVEFKNLVKKKLRVKYVAVEKAHEKIIDRVRKNQRVANAEEYKLVVSRVDQIFSDPVKSEELRALNDLLVKYERFTKEE